MEGGVAAPKRLVATRKLVPIKKTVATKKPAAAKPATMSTSLLSAVTSTLDKTTTGIASTATTTAVIASDVSSSAKSISTWFSANLMYISIGTLIVIGIILLILWSMGLIFKSKPTPSKTAATLATAVANSTPLSGSSREGFQVPTVPPQAISAEETTFINLQPLSIKDGGFIGPYPSGKYDPPTAVGNALMAGFRFITLHIDYMDTMKDGYEVTDDPTLIIRAENGGLLSSNSGSIASVATTIANMAFRPEVPHSIQPVILYLHIQRSPSKLTNPNGYLSFLSKIAKALNPIAPMHLGLMPLGNFTRQKMADTLLTTPLKSIEGHVVILSNADTSLFRSTSSSITKYNPNEDLDFWVNMRVYLDSEEDRLGISSLADPSATISAVVVDLNRILALSPANAEAFAEKAKKKYIIAIGSRTKNPTVKELNKAINTLGVNAVPIDIFTEDTAVVMNLVSEYANMPYHPKPVALRNIS